MADDATPKTLNDLSERVAMCDPSAGKSHLQRQAARSAVVVVAADAWHRIFVLEAWADRCSTPALVERIFRINEQFQPRVFGIEANAMQSTFGDTVAMLASERKIRLPRVPVYQDTRVDKDFRIRNILQPIITDGRLFLAETGQEELHSEIVSFPQKHEKDLVDALASACSLLPRRTVARQQAEDADQLAAYLRETGAPASVIERRMREVRLGG